MTAPSSPSRPPERGPDVGPAGVPDAVVTRRRRWPLVWLVPIAAAALVAYLAYTTFARRGPIVTVTFRTAEGLQVKQTQVKYKAVALGTVESIRLSDDKTRVVVRIRMDREATPLLTDHARFWVVRPRVNNLAGLAAGIETLVSGVYVGLDPGASGAKTGATVGRPERSFEGLEEPPAVRSDEPGRVFVLRTDRLGSLSDGAPIFYRDARVGEVLNYDLGGGAGPLTLHVFVQSPYDVFVRPSSRFWNVSGLTVSSGAEGLHVEAQSIQAVVSGGIAFSTPDIAADGAPSPDGAAFSLYPDEETAKDAGYGARLPCVTYVRSAVQGLAVGSAVEMFGVRIGSVTDMRLVFDAPAEAPSDAGRPAERIAFDLEPERVRATPSEVAEPKLRAMVEGGLRAVVQSASLVTGQKALALQFVPGVKAAKIGREDAALVLPSEAGGIDDIAVSLGDVAAKLNQIPFDAIGKNVDRALRSVSDTVGGPEVRDALHSFSGAMQEISSLAQHANEGMTPMLARLPALSEQLQQAAERANAALGEGGYGENSDFQRGAARLMDQMTDTVRAVRQLAEFLDHHPEALLRGRSSPAAGR